MQNKSFVDKFVQVAGKKQSRKSDVFPSKVSRLNFYNSQQTKTVYYTYVYKKL